MHQSIRNKSSGFTLIEVLVTLVVIAIMAAVSAPAILSMAPNMALKSVAQDLYSSFQQAKILAIKENRDVTVRFDTPGLNYIDEDGDGNWDINEPHVFFDEDFIIQNNTLDAGEDVNGNGRLDTKYGIGIGTGNATNDWNNNVFGPVSAAITFNSRGLATTTDSTFIENQNGQCYAITVSVAGSIKIRKYGGEFPFNENNWTE